MANYIAPTDEPTITLNDVGGSALDFAKTQQAPIDAALANYVATARAQDKPLDIFTSLENAAGIPMLKSTATTLQGQVNDLEDAINQVKKNVQARSTQSIVTNAQQAGMVTAGKQPLLEQLSPIATALGRIQGSIQNAGADVATKTGLVMQGQQNELGVNQYVIGALADRAARLTSGFSSDQQTQLALLMDKLSRGRQLADTENAQLFELKKLEKQYELEKSQYTYQLQQNAQYNPSRSTISLGDNQTALIDPNTGNVIRTYGNPPAASTTTPTAATKYLTASSSYLPTALDYSNSIASLWGGGW